jgi:UDP-glucose 4-epimerase/UDP-glucuronate decarboxylase
MNVLITGGAGFIGCHLARYHAQRGESVHIFDSFFKTGDRPDPDLDQLRARPNCRVHRIDLTRPVEAGIDVGPIDIVYHLAAINGTRLFYEMPYHLARANLLMTLNLLDWLEGRKDKVGRLLYTSTSEVYAGGETLGLLKVPTDESIPVAFPQPTDRRFSYGTSKFMGEFLCFQFGSTCGVPASVIRYHNIYGPRMGDKHVIPEFIARVARRETPFAIYGGSETRAFCHIGDAVRATHGVATTAACDQQIVHIGNPREEITIERLARRVMATMGIDLPIEERGRRSASVSRRCPDTARLRALTGFEAQVPLEEGLRETVEWYLRKGSSGGAGQT